MGDWPRGQTRSSSCESSNGSFTRGIDTFLSAFIDPSSTTDIKSSFAKTEFYTSSNGPYLSEDRARSFSTSRRLFSFNTWHFRAECHFGPGYGQRWRGLSILVGPSRVKAQDGGVRDDQRQQLPKIRINDQIVSLLPRRYRVDGAFLRKSVRAPRGDGMDELRSLPPISLVAARWVWEKSGKNDGRTSHAAIGF
jgi:hypothetical protein